MPVEPSIVWERPPANLRLAPHELHLWCADLAASAPPLAALQATLAPDELERAQRFQRTKDQRQFIAARGLLRRLLGQYLPLPPAALRFQYGAQGKPELVNEPTLQFNLAHSEELILYAVTWGQAVGVDVEFMRREMSEETIAEQFFAPAEVAALRALPATQQPQAFFHCWTRKEAYLKARGDGLSFPLDAFAVSLETPVTLQVYQSPQESERWRLYHLPLKAQYVGAVAAAGNQHTLRFFSPRWLDG